MLAATALASVMTYALILGRDPSWAKLLLDLALLAGCLGVLRRTWSHVGLASAGPQKARVVLALLAAALLATLASQALVPHQGDLTLDERNYLEMIRHGDILRYGLAPFHRRWLVPVLAGRWNLTPLSEMEALAAINFASLVVTGGYLALLLVRLGAKPALAALAPVFLLGSYLGGYAASNRMVIDPFNYAMYVLLAHVLLRRAHLALFAPLLLVATLASEKALYWVPILGLVEWLRAPAPWKLRAFGAGLVAGVRYGWPAMAYAAAMALYAPGEATAFMPCLENIHYLSFTSFEGVVDNPRIPGSNFRVLWFPFGAFTAFALLGMSRSPRWLLGLCALLVPIAAQAHIACDTRRMVAYAFIVYLPLGFCYLAEALDELPRGVGWGLVGVLALTSFGGRFAGADAQTLLALLTGAAPSANAVKAVLSIMEVTCAVALLVLHHLLTARPGEGMRRAG